MVCSAATSLQIQQMIMLGLNPLKDVWSVQMQYSSVEVSCVNKFYFHNGLPASRVLCSRSEYLTASMDFLLNEDFAEQSSQVYATGKTDVIW